MSANQNANSNANGNTSQGQGQGQGLTVQQKQLMELTNRFKQLVSEAKSLGENSQRGKELLKQAAKIKMVYDNYNRQRQQAAAAAAAAAAGSSSTSSGASSGNAMSQQQNSAGSDSTASASGTSNSGSITASQFTNMLREALTPEQKVQHDKLLNTIKTRASAVKDKRSYIKTHIDKLTAEINKQEDPATKAQIAEKRNELVATLKALNDELATLYGQLQSAKKTFFVKCSSSNPRLRQLLEKSTEIVAQQRQQKQQQQQQSNAGTPAATPNAVVQTPGAAAARPAVKEEPMAGNNISTPGGQQSPKNNGNMNRSTSQMSSASSPAGQQKGQQGQGSGTSAAVATNPSATSKSTIFKPTDPSVPVSENVNAKTPDAVAVRSNRPTITGGSGMNAASLNTPAVTKLPPYEIDTERVMSKRKLRELVKVVGVDEGDGETVIDGDVEELLLDLADDFITNVTAFACRLAKHRKSDNLESKDIQLHLEKNWNIRIPGYSSDEIRSTRKWNPSHGYNQKLQNINADKTGSTKHSGSGHKK